MLTCVESCWTGVHSQATPLGKRTVRAPTEQGQNQTKTLSTRGRGSAGLALVPMPLLLGLKVGETLQETESVNHNLRYQCCNIRSEIIRTNHISAAMSATPPSIKADLEYYMTYIARSRPVDPSAHFLG